MTDRSSWPGRMPRATTPSTVARILALQRKRFTDKHIAHGVGVSPATVSRVLKRAGLSRHQESWSLRVRRSSHYRRSQGQPNNHGIGWDFVHVCIDDAAPGDCPTDRRRCRRGRRPGVHIRQNIRRCNPQLIGVTDRSVARCREDAMVNNLMALAIP